MSTTITAGNVTVEINDAGLLALIDRINDGAASRLLAVVVPRFKTIQENAEKQWPRGWRKGRTRSADRFALATTVSKDTVEVSLSNDARSPKGVLYPQYVRWSVRTSDSLDAEARQAATRADTPENATAIYNFMRNNKLRRKHGFGAPNAQVAGKSAWVTLVRTPGNAAKKQIVEEASAEIVRLAGGR